MHFIFLCESLFKSELTNLLSEFKPCPLSPRVTGGSISYPACVNSIAKTASYHEPFSEHRIAQDTNRHYDAIH